MKIKRLLPRRIFFRFFLLNFFSIFFIQIFLIFFLRIDSYNHLFIYHNLIVFIIIVFINFFFIKNQFKPLRFLIKHIKNFSLNSIISFFKPFGSKEIRELTSSIFDLENKIINYVNKNDFFFKGVMHDLKTPLTRINLELEFFDKNKTKFIKKDVSYITNIVNRYIGFLKNDEKEEKNYFNVYDCLKHIVNNYKSLNKKIKFNTKNIDKREIIFVQKIAFERVIQNVLDNAIKFGSNIDITLKKRYEKIIIKIDNNGKITNKEIENIQNLFNSKKSNNYELLIVKSILLRNDGEIFFKKSKKGGLSVSILFNIV